MAKRHSKMKNTGLIFELLIRKLTSDILNSEENLDALTIINKYFSKDTELLKELHLYQSLHEGKFKTDKLANQLIDATLGQRKKLDQKKLRSEKYELIKEINMKFNNNNFFNARITNYKINASINQIFDNIMGKNIRPDIVLKSRVTLIEYINNNTKLDSNTSNLVSEEYKKLDNELKTLTYRTLIKKFNEKYKDLNPKQKYLIKEYINNISDGPKLKEYIEGEIPIIKRQLTQYGGKIDDDIVLIKINEVKSQIKNFVDGTIIQDKHVFAMMNYYQLIEELKKL